MNIFSCCSAAEKGALFPYYCVNGSKGRRKNPGTVITSRLCFVLLLITLSTLSLKAQTISLNEHNTPIKEVLKKITQQSSYKFWYGNEILENAVPVTIHFENYKLKDALDAVFAGQPLSYKIIDKTITINKKHVAAAEPSKEETGKEISGVVVDSLGLALNGATVSVKGTKITTSTDKNGHFKLPHIPEDAIISVSFVGFSPQEVRPASTSVKITLTVLSSELNEITITNGYQTFDKRTLTSSITSVKASDILVPGMFSIDQALEGRVPGLFVMNNSGEVGAAPKIRIRGTSTVLGSQEPIWVVDGVVVNDPVHVDASSINDLDFVNRVGNAISGLNPNDIDHIDVLKDASATALYGVRAANGVIVVTTKKGFSGPPVISFSTSTTFTRRPRYTDGNINLMNSRERVDLSREIIDKKLPYPAFINYVGYEGALYNYYNGAYNYYQFQQQVHKLETMNTDWFGIITHDALSTQNNLSVSGGNNKTRYFASFGAETQGGTVKSEQVNTYTVLLKINTNVSSRLNWDINFRGNVGKRNYVASNINALNYAYNTSRDVAAFNNDGSPYYYKKYGSFNYYNFNIINEMQNSRDLSNSMGLNLINTLAYRFNNELKGSAIFSYGVNDVNQAVSFTANTYYAAVLRMSEYGVAPPTYSSLLPVGGELRTNDSKNYNYLGRLQFDYNKAFGTHKQHQLSAAMGGEISSTRYNAYTAAQRGYLPERGKTFAAVVPTTYTAYANWALTSNFPQITDQLTNLLSGYFTTTYTYKSRYSINFNTRSDYSNKFGSRSNEKFLPTWSLSGRWNASDDFFKGSKAINMLAFRWSYGSQGNIPDNQTPQLIIQRGALDPVTNEYTSAIKYYPNPNLHWEKTTQVNGAVDFSLFNNAIVGYVSYYYKKTNDVFVDKAVTDVNGVDSYIINSGTLVNKGIEVALSFTPINNALSGGKKFVWRIDPQIGQAINSLLSKKNANTATANANTYTNYLTGTEVIDGHALNTFYSYQFNGLSPVNGVPLFKNDANTQDNISSLKSMTKDQIFQYVMTPSGSRVPTIQGGVYNYIAYKNFSLGVNLSYSFGSKVRLLALYQSLSGDAKSYNTSVPVPEQNVSREFINRWKAPGDEKRTNIPGFLNGPDYNQTITHWSYGQSYNYAVNIWQMYDNSDIRVASGNFVKVKSMSFRYSMPDRFCKKAKLQNASLSFSGTNLYTFASKQLHGQDPEQSGFASAIQLSSRPTYSLGIQVAF